MKLGVDAKMERVGIAADHAGYELKSMLVVRLKANGFAVRDFGAHTMDLDDDYPNYVIPLARAVVAARVTRGIAVCGSGAGACIVANKIPGVRAALVHEVFTARQAVEDDDMNLICLGGDVLGPALAWELTQVFLAARFSEIDRHIRRLVMVRELEKDKGFPNHHEPTQTTCEVRPEHLD